MSRRISFHIPPNAKFTSEGRRPVDGEGVKMSRFETMNARQNLSEDAFGLRRATTWIFTKRAARLPLNRAFVSVSFVRR
jgi:hypothetical protein